MEKTIQTFASSLSSELYIHDTTTSQDWAFNLRWLRRMVEALENDNEEISPILQRVNNTLKSASFDLRSAFEDKQVKTHLRSAYRKVSQAAEDARLSSRFRGVKKDQATVRDFISKVKGQLKSIEKGLEKIGCLEEENEDLAKKLAENICMAARLHFLLTEMLDYLEVDGDERWVRCRRLHDTCKEKLGDSREELVGSVESRIKLMAL